MRDDGEPTRRQDGRQIEIDLGRLVGERNGSRLDGNRSRGTGRGEREEKDDQSGHVGPVTRRGGEGFTRTAGKGGLLDSPA